MLPVKSLLWRAVYSKIAANFSSSSSARFRSSLSSLLPLEARVFFPLIPGEACRLRQLEMAEDELAIAAKRDRLQSLLLQKIPNLVVNGDTTSRLAGNLHISIPDIPNTAVVARVRSKLAISTGAACSSGVEAPSYVLQALGLSSEVMEGALRIGIGKFTTEEEISQTAEILSNTVNLTRKAMCFQV